MAMFRILLAALVALIGCEAAPLASVDAPSADAAGPDSATTRTYLLDDLTGEVGVTLAYRESSRWSFDHDDGWMVRIEHRMPIAGSATRYAFTATLYADVPGTGPFAAGAKACEIRGEDEVYEVDGFAPLDRVHLVSRIDENSCTGMTGVKLNKVLEVRARGGDGKPTLIASWQVGDGQLAEEFEGWLWQNGSGANPWLPCAQTDHAESRAYCAVACDWSFLTPPVGACPE